MRRSRRSASPSPACSTDTVARYAIGDVQGCAAELRALLDRLDFSADRDQLWFVGDLVNRGPDSLGVLRFVKALGDNAIVVLGNHDLHLLARAHGAQREAKRGDTLDDILAARDRRSLLDWLRSRHLAWQDPVHGELLIHAGLLPQWTVTQTLALAAEVEQSLRDDPDALFADMYGNDPDRWSDALRGMPRLRCVINALTRLRYCTADGSMKLKLKQAPDDSQTSVMPWFSVPHRASRGTTVVFGHWSTLGFHTGDGVIALDTGCVWGGTLSAWSFEKRRVVSEPCRGYQPVGGD